MKGFEIREIALRDIIINESVNLRELDNKLVAEYQKDMEEYGVNEWQDRWIATGGWVKTVEINGEIHLYGGFHTHRAALNAFGADHKLSVLVNINIDIPEECRVPALLAGGENATHGRRRTNDEKREAVDRWLKCEHAEDSNKWSDGYIAKMTQTTAAYVRKREKAMREELGEAYTRPEDRYSVRRGKIQIVDVSTRRTFKPKPKPEEPTETEALPRSEDVTRSIRKPPAQLERNGWPAEGILVVYFVQGEVTRRIKIGETDNLIERITNLRGSQSSEKLTVLGWMEADENTERELHDQFAGDRAHKEWFYNTVAILQFIVEHTHRIYEE